MKRSRIFGIGLHKTATASLSAATEVLGFSTMHHGWRIDANLERAIRAGKPLFRYSRPRVRLARAFFDLPAIEQHFDVVDKQFPGSYFILSTRDKGEWLKSCEMHVRRNQEAAAAGTYDRDWLTIEPAVWSEQWDSHHARIHEYFRGRDDLLVINVPAGDGWEKLAPFLGKVVPSEPFPSLNRFRH